jgi:hypothetical protein
MKLFRKRQPILEPPPCEVEHIPCLYELTTIDENGLKQLWEVIATSPGQARSQVFNAVDRPVRIVRTYREGFIV